MELFHVTLLENLDGILRDGLRASKSGLDGPGVYLWRGPLEDAVREADWSLSDNHDEMSEEEYGGFTRRLVMLAVEVPDDACFSVEWPEYVVWDVGIVAREKITPCGILYDLLEKYCDGVIVEQDMAKPLETVLDSAHERCIRDSCSHRCERVSPALPDGVVSLRDTL